ncbi:MAG: O-antigen ligase family protein [Bacteroidota bacterium]
MSNYFNFFTLTKEAYLFFLSVLLISLAYPSPPITIVSYIALIFFSLIYNLQSGISFAKNKSIIFVILAYFLTNWGTHIFIEDTWISIKLWKLQSFVLVFLAIFFGPKIQRETLRRLQYYFVGSVVLCSLVGLVKTVFLYQRQLINSFTYINYATELGVLSTYFAVFVCIALAFLISWFFSMSSIRYKTFSAMLIAYLFLVLYLLSVRISWLAVGVVFLIYMYKYRSQLKQILLVLILAILVLLAANYITGNAILERITNVATTNSYIEISDVENRLHLWSCAMQEYNQKASYLWGVGIEKYQELLNSCYFEAELFHAHDQSYNTHNQYLQSLLNTGTLGLMVFLLILILSLRKAIQYKMIDFFAVLLLFALFFVTESFFEKTLGIVAYACFLGVYWNLINQKEAT